MKRVEDAAKASKTSGHTNKVKQDNSQQIYENNVSKSEESETREILAQFDQHDDQHLEQSPGPIEVTLYAALFRTTTSPNRSQSR